MTNNKKTQIKKFLNKNGENLNIPFLKKSEKYSKILNIFQKTLQILPSIVKNSNQSEDFSPKIKNTNNFKQNFRSILPKLDQSSTKTIVKLDKTAKNELLFWAKSGKISNKLQTIDKNNYLIKLPALEEGKKPVNEIKARLNADVKGVFDQGNTNLAELLSPSGYPKDTEKTKQNISSAGINIGEKSKENNKPTKPSLKTIPSNTLTAKFEPNATTAGGEEGAKIAVIAEKPGTPPTAALVGENGKEEIKQTGEVSPIKTLSKQLPTKEENQLEKNEETSSSIEALNMAESAKANSLSGGLLKPINSIKSVGKLGKISSMFSGVKGMASGGIINTLSGVKGMASGGIINTLSGVKGMASGGIINALKNKSSLDIGNPIAENIDGQGQRIGPMSGNMSQLPSSKNAIGMLGSTMLSGGSAVGVGGIAAGLGSAMGGIASGLGAGLGTLSNLSPLGMLGMLVNRTNEEDKKVNMLTTQGNSVSPTNITNISYQYDIYRKTADDAFMLPNFRREYG